MSTRLRPARRLAGQLLISAVAIGGPAGAIGADWNETHVFNPNWPPHDPEFADRLPVVAGVRLNQLVPVFAVIGPLLAVGYSLAAGGTDDGKPVT